MEVGIRAFSLPLGLVAANPRSTGRRSASLLVGATKLKVHIHVHGIETAAVSESTKAFEARDHVANNLVDCEDLGELHFMTSTSYYADILGRRSSFLIDPDARPPRRFKISSIPFQARAESEGPAKSIGTSFDVRDDSCPWFKPCLSMDGSHRVSYK
jgi:hypothetical protein